MRRRAVLAAATLLALPGQAPAEVPPAACPGPDEGPAARIAVVTGRFPAALEGAYVLVPFDVPAGMTRLRVKICYDQPDLPVGIPGVVSLRNVLDLGLYEPRPPGDRLYDVGEFRGWGGSSRPNVLLTPEAAPSKTDLASGTTVGFRPGPVPAGRWAAEIGVAAVGSPLEGDLDRAVAWRLEVYAAARMEDLDDPWRPAPYDERPARAGPGWYAGDFHVHAEHSNPSDSSMRETFDYAFRPRPAGAGLDFITLSDYVTDRHWGEIGRFQADYPGKLIIRSAEVITYRGHVNNHASLALVDYRTGPIYERRPDGALRLVRGPQPARRIFRDIHAARDLDGRPRGWTQVNHPATFPSRVPTFATFCRGCSWSYSDAETDWSQVDAFEVATGPAGLPAPEGNEPGPNPFTLLAFRRYDHLRRMGYDITAVGSSDAHRAGSPSGITQSPIGEATTVVYARELSERGIRDAILAGHAYVKLFSPAGPDLRFTARPAGGGPEAMMGDEITAERALFVARVLGAPPTVHPRVLLVLRDGLPHLAQPVVGEEATVSFAASLPGDYRLQLMRGTAIEALSNPITLRRPAVATGAGRIRGHEA